MAEIVNLRNARKRKHRAEAQASASENRVRHGRSHGEQAGADLSRQLRETRLDGHRREVGDAENSEEPSA